MHTVGLDLSRFISREIIDELELDKEPVHLNLFSIDEDNDKASTSQHQHAGLTYVPTYFHSRLLIPNNNVLQVSRPATHELVGMDDEVVRPISKNDASRISRPFMYESFSPDDEVIRSTGRSKTAGRWPFARTTSPVRITSSFTDHGVKQPRILNSPRSSSPPLTENEEEKRIDLSSNFEASSDKKSEDMPLVSRLRSKWMTRERAGVQCFFSFREQC